ncbi:PREDICTED: glucan endo-1,3-beta-glucosidase-like [Fragaria vesca subsp. vesca]|uniref:glucan endo-1,3-beta-glucosidase-like n=1 Tax=Fragaria vesca subsp. vesca TaxID=101020 RepID=UPI0002C31728|nr:PREDICTED: glucan endo-1,3-beta-glucosidase-like [Fragaria vesca subsp. vesca]
MAVLGCIALILCVIASFDNHAGRVGALDIGVCYGTLGSDLPAPADVVNLYKQHGIAKMRIFNPNPAILDALRGSGIAVTIGIPNEDLENLATGQGAVDQWWNNNIAPYVNDVTINYIAIGNEVDPSVGLKNVLAVMPLLNNIQIVHDRIKVTTVLSSSVLASSYPPSIGEFTPEASSTMAGILAFLASTDSPLMINVYPYFAYKSDPGNVRLDYAQFTATETVVQDGEYGYVNLFDAIVDAFVAAMDKAGGATNVRVVVSESGWPSDGSGSITTPELAATYNKNLLNHILQKGGTPRRPGANIEGFIFAMFNENQKPAGEEQHFGLFYPNMQPVYDIFS